jgi:hypothetical protein
MAQLQHTVSTTAPTDFSVTTTVLVNQQPVLRRFAMYLINKLSIAMNGEFLFLFQPPNTPLPSPLSRFN